ncbi:MAG: Asp-tRNA(Asn)/Glu-tRNA(Gln) amidotransferase subunit GatA [Proteobacteria bacterium]|nr:Asp-tRNA(Asn)/Glu-tRNA(Gln) amidotransferase subunit GatA [Pseudomonadota bacterium]
MNLYELSIEKANKLLTKKEISSKELTQSVLDRIDAVDEKVGAYITVDHEGALKAAEAADKKIQAEDVKALTGIPLGIKDLICTDGLLTTCGSKILSNFVPPYDATVIEKLKSENAVFAGKLNMDEFAMGSTTENSSLKNTCNPFDLSRIPGGSSGGSAASVAAGICLGSLGSDTGGSIRQPASHCGVVGMKPTYGRVSRYGLVAFASSLDQIGPLAKNVTDCAIIMNAISGYDRRDSTSVDEKVPDFYEAIKRNGGVKGLKIGIPKEYNSTEGLDPKVSESVNNAIAELEKLGAQTVEISLPHTEYAVAAYYVLAPSEASSNLARYDGVRYGVRTEKSENLIDMYHKTRTEGFGDEVKRRIIIGTYALSSGYYDAYYKKASQIRTLIMDDFKKAFEVCDVIASPVAPTPAPLIGENTDDPLAMYLSDVFTLSANLAGVPGISVPCGFSDGLPIGLQLMGKHFDEETLLKVAYNYEQATDYMLKIPQI